MYRVRIASPAEAVGGAAGGFRQQPVSYGQSSPAIRKKFRKILVTGFLKTI